MKPFVFAALILFALMSVIVTLAIGFGGPHEPRPMASMNNPFKSVDFSDLPAIRRYTARDGTQLAFRQYPAAGANPKGSVVLVHGSSARGDSMHVMAKAFAAAGYTAYALDMRGHGESGSKGNIAYVGQLEDDIEDFTRALTPAMPATLAGFSSGGGFVLLFAGSDRQVLFSNYLLLSPFISQDAPTFRPDSGGWVSVGVPRLMAIGLLNAIDIHALNGLPVVRFALSEQAKSFLTPQYSYALTQNFRPQADWQANIRAVRQPLRLVAGQDDEAFHAERFAEVFKAAGKDVPVTLLPGIGHIPLTLDRSAVQAAVTAVNGMNRLR
ncbi:alpha/beta hydrolase [Collimonas sp. NPDC087041]|uniref:alpha/beta hydrolase n=1 Tax=Collimonas sp. NPDC087041 TaxID=3363960 RepID=UPI00382911F1